MRRCADQLCVVESDRPRRSQGAGNRLQQRGLASTVRTDDRNSLTGYDLQCGAHPPGHVDVEVQGHRSAALRRRVEIATMTMATPTNTSPSARASEESVSRKR